MDKRNFIKTVIGGVAATAGTNVLAQVATPAPQKPAASATPATPVAAPVGAAPTAPAAPAAPKPTDAQAAAEKKRMDANTKSMKGTTTNGIRLGQSVPLTGPAADLGIEYRDGALAYFKWVNQNGGVDGKPIDLITVDDQYDPAKCADNTRLLIESGISALFGYVGTPTSVAARPLFEKANTIFVAPFTGAESLRSPVSPLIFNLRASYFDETERIVEHVLAMNLNKIAVFYQNDAYGQAGLAGVKKAMGSRKIEIIETATVERNSTAVDAAVEKLSQKNPDAIVMISAYASCAQFIKNYRKTGKISQYYNVSFVGSSALAEALGDDGYGVVISQVVPAPTDRSYQVIAEYQQRAKQSNPKGKYTFGGVEGFLAAKLMVEALRRAKGNYSTESLQAALNGIQNVNLGNFWVSFSESNHSGSKFVDLTLIGKNRNFIF